MSGESMNKIKTKIFHFNVAGTKKSRVEAEKEMNEWFSSFPSYYAKLIDFKQSYDETNRCLIVTVWYWESETR